MLQKFGSNLSFKLEGNFVNSMNSTHRSGYTGGDLRFASRRGRGRLWRRAGAVKAIAQLPCASELLYLAQAVAVGPVLLLCFPDATAIAPASPHHLPSAVVVLVKTVPVPSFSCASTQPTVVG